MPTISIRNYLTTSQVAELIGVSAIRVRQFAKEKRLHGIQLGNILVFDQAEVKKFAKQPRKNGRPSTRKK